MNRSLYRLTGQDALPFLQGLVSNDVLPLAKGPGLVYAALLTPQGKYLCDFFVAQTAHGLILDLPEALAEATIRRLSMYRLRADVQITPAPDLFVHRGLGPCPADGFADPRHASLGWWAVRATAPTETIADWTALRVAALVPEAGIELIPDESYILEAGFERLNGVDFRKGCYVGQEVTARMKHKTELRKGLVRVAVEGAAPPGTPIVAQGKEAGLLFSQSGGQAIAWVRHDRLAPVMRAGEAVVCPLD